MSRRSLTLLGLLALGLVALLLLWRDVPDIGEDHRLATSSTIANRVGPQTAIQEDASKTLDPLGETQAQIGRAEETLKRNRLQDTVLSVVVVDSETRRPIEGATVQIKWLDRFDGPGSHRATLVTDSRGEAASPLPAGLYRVKVERQGYGQIGSWIPAADRGFEKFTWFGLPEGGATKTVEMTQLITVVGTVRNDLGEPLSEVLIRFEEEGLDFRRVQAGLPSGTALARSTTDDDGRFEVDLDSGSYRLEARRRAAKTVIEDLQVDADMARVSVVLPEDRSLIPLAGQVVSDTGEAVEGAGISIFVNRANERAQHLYGVTSDENGDFAASAPPDIPVYLSVSKRGYKRERYDLTGSDETDVEIVLTQFRSFRVRVLDADGIELQHGVNVHGLNLDEPPVPVVRRLRDDDSIYYSTSLPFQIFADAQGLGEGRSAIRLIERYEPEIELHLERSDGRFHGRVVDGDGQPVSLLALLLTCPGWLRDSTQIVIAEDGAFTVSGLPVARCKLIVVAPLFMLANPGIRPYTREVDIRADSPEFIEVMLKPGL